MTNNSVSLEESEVIRLILQFLNSRRLHKSMRNLERESGVTNCSFTEDVVFLRQLILDGEWDAILTFAKPLEKIEDFDVRKFRYLVLKEKFMEVLYFKSGVEGVSSSYSIEDLIKCLNQLEKDCPFKSDYTKLCWLLTVPDLHEQPEYKDWNPETARIKCFREVLELLKNVMPVEKRNNSNKVLKNPSKDRLINLIVKGLCFESCVDYCHERAINGEPEDDILSVNNEVLLGTSHESTGNFLSWLRSLPQESFLAPFEPMSLDVEFKKAELTRKFHLSNKRLQHEAENLSKSLSLSPRPSTADNARRSTSATKNISMTAKGTEPNETSQSVLATVKKVSSSYSDFHYKGDMNNKSFQPIKNESNDEASSRVENEDTRSCVFGTATPNRVDGTNKSSEIHKDIMNKDVTYKDASHRVHTLHNKIEGIAVNDKQTVKSGMVDRVQGVSDSQDSIDRLKSNQESSVLKRLAEHEQKQMELRQQLLYGENSDALSNGTENLNVQVNRKDLNGRSADSNNGKMYYTTTNQTPQSFETRNEPLQKQIKIENQNSPDKDEIIQSNGRMCRESPVGKEVSPSFKDDYAIEAPSHYAVTSTPLMKKRIKPEPLSFDTISNEEASQYELQADGLHISKQKCDAKKLEEDLSPKEQVRQPVNQVPKTPMTNVLAGHWIALKDGSGVMNTSTPKSCREKMSNTPGPPASPVYIQNTTADVGKSNPVSDEREQFDQVSPDVAEHLQNENQENQAVTADDNAAPRRGPKINGVRRSLVSTGPPMSRNKISVTPPEERREAKTPRQEKTNSKNVDKDIKGRSNLISSPKDRNTPNQKQAPARKSSKEEMGSGKQKNSGTTFVVDNDKPRSTSNLTYRKPPNQSFPSNLNEPKSNETKRLMERQKEHLSSTSEPIQFCNIASLEDVQAVRAIAFHPSGELFAIGSNSKTLRVCSASGLNTYKKMESNSELIAPQPTILFKHNRHHKGSIYCIAWNNAGDLIATGSNDKSIKVVHFDAENCTQIGPEMEMNIHNGTVRDLVFASRSGGSNVLVSGGAGNGNILISDSSTGNTIGQLSGHSGHIMSVFAAKDDIIASGSNDNTVRLWDLRSQRCIDVIATGDSCVASVCVNPTSRLLSSGHEDGGCMIYDISAGRTLQFFKPHTLDCRSVRFSPDGHYLITGSYDTSIIILDMQHNLECSIPPYSIVAQHRDKVIQCRWHPHLMAFVSSSADKTARLWTLDC